MDVFKARQELRTCNLKDLTLRVVYYDRVSLDKEAQKSSLVNQDYYNQNFIKANSKWRLIGRYVDDAYSGLSAEKRPGFSEMIADAKKGKFDLIITKEVSRFARNTLDSIAYSRKLLEYGVGIMFTNNNLCTLTEDSEFLLTLMSGQAQEESRRISNRVKFGQAQSIKRGHVLGTDNMYGYTKKDCILTIEPKGAKMVYYIFSEYATGTTSTNRLAEDLYNKGYRNRYGKKINSRTISNIIRNPKYKGYFCGGKVTIEDMFSKKQRFIPEDEWTMFKDETGSIVPAIVPEEMWDTANRIMEKRVAKLFSGDRKTSYKKDNFFTGKIICANCGQTYWMRARGKGENRNDLTWECCTRKRQGKDACDSFGIKQSELLEIITNIIQIHLGNYNDVVEDYLDLLKSALGHSKELKKEESIKKAIADIETKRGKLLDHSLSGRISDEDFLKKDQELKSVKMELEAELSPKRLTAEEQYRGIATKIHQHVNEIKSVQPNNIDQKVIDTLFDRIYAKKIDEGKMHLTFIMNIGADIEEVYNRNKLKKGPSDERPKSMCRSDTIVKKMIEQQERQMAGK
uniref:recombinase family protein n=1 Tax=Lachnoclostridium phocaeense TaxID=1871021 RepID=UPI0026DAAB35|nr:recombinase family protein [Lachnoclostridium phocaeense]